MSQICPHCQATNDDTVTFCFRCGTRLDQPTDTIIADFGPRSAGGAKGGKSNLLVPLLVGGGVLLCLVVVIVGAAVYFGRDRIDEPPFPTVPPTVTVESPTEVPMEVTVEVPIEVTTAVPTTPTPDQPPPPPTVTPKPTDDPLPTLTPTDQPPTPNQYGLQVGIQVSIFTTEGDKLRMRDAPGTHGQVVAALSTGTLVSIVDGPVTDAGGLTWWKVSTGDGKTGWCVEFIDGIQTLKP